MGIKILVESLSDGLLRHCLEFNCGNRTTQMKVVGMDMIGYGWEVARSPESRCGKCGKGQ